MPFLGIGLGIITLLNERKKDVKNKKALCTGLAGLILNIGGAVFAFYRIALTRTP